jgi:hypothetical protein
MMMHTSEIDMANSDEPVDIDTFINNAAWAICKNIPYNIKSLTRCSTTLEYDTILDVPFVAHWYIGE